MPASVQLETVSARRLAAVRREVVAGAVAAAWKPSLDLVWKFLRTREGLWRGGQNVFVYERSEGNRLTCHFGVEVTDQFVPDGEVRPAETPAGEAVVAVYFGPYDRLGEAHEAILAWLAANAREGTGVSWEIYGDPKPDPWQTETRVLYALKGR